MDTFITITIVIIAAIITGVASYMLSRSNFNRTIAGDFNKNLKEMKEAFDANKEKQDVNSAELPGSQPSSELRSLRSLRPLPLSPSSCFAELVSNGLFPRTLPGKG